MQERALEAVTAAATELRVSERATAAARARLEAAILAASEVAKHGQIASVAGVSRQRVQQLLAKRLAEHDRRTT